MINRLSGLIIFSFFLLIFSYVGSLNYYLWLNQSISFGEKIFVGLFILFGFVVFGIFIILLSSAHCIKVTFAED